MAKDMEAILVRMPRELVQALDEYRRTVSDLPTRPEAVRRLVAERLGLSND